MKLIFNGPDYDGQTCEFGDGKFSVGRSPDNWLVIQDPSVSHHHCEIEVNGPEVIVREKDSANGTWVGDSRITGQQQARHGQVVRFGVVSARIELPPPSQDFASDVTAVNMHLDLLKQERRKQGNPAPERTVIRPRSAASSQDQTIAMPGIRQHVKADPEPATPAAPPRKSRSALYLLLIATAAALAYAVWRYSQRR